jgi:hypothetical protein
MRPFIVIAAFLIVACRTSTLEVNSVDADGDDIVGLDDCDDSDASVFPGAAELCDGIDNNCDGQIDELSESNNLVVYEDADGDGFGDEAIPLNACVAPEGYTDVIGDCDDTDPAFNPDAVEDDCTDTNDYNCDGALAFDDADDDGFLGCLDCDDQDPTINADAAELCDGIDNNCDGERDNDAIDRTDFYTDADADGYGDPEAAELACFQPSGTSANPDDCDDTDPTIHPNATERCNGVDDDCDTLTDNNALDAATWYMDADSDGHGNARETVESCDIPDGYGASNNDCNDQDVNVSPSASEQCNGIDDNCVAGTDEGFDADADGVTVCGGDCDDEDPLRRPGAIETCNSIDDNCDGLTDNNAVDQSAYWVDLDEDGFGAAGSLRIQACEAPDGRVGNAADCDDATASINPRATESCNGVDDNCADGIDEGFDADGDGATTCAGDCDDEDPTRRPGLDEFCNGVDDDCDTLVDDEDDGRVGGSVYYTDADGDLFGAIGSEVTQCIPDANQTPNPGDCNDDEAGINPAREERCNDIDDNCNGETDESPIDGFVFYEDADMDTFGNADSESNPECAAPDGFVDNAEDCDDSSSVAYPSAAELLNGADDDCDGIVDEGQPYGSGQDGVLVADERVDLSTYTSPGRIAPDGVSYGIIGLTDNSATLDDLANGIAPGDELLLANLHGSDARYDSVGTWGFVNVLSINGAVVTFDAPLGLTLGDPDNNDLSDQSIVAVRVPHYSSITIGSAGSITTAAWDGTTGGIVAVRALAGVTIEGGGSFDVNALGYAGGDTGTSGPDCDAFQGESYAGQGEGQGNGSCNAYNEVTEQWRANYGGGGAHISGGGGEYAGGALSAASWTGGSATPASAGMIYGTPDLGELFFGSGGGGVWSSQPTRPRNIGPGGAGGGILYVASPTITAQGARAFTSQGETTPHWGTGSWTYGAGGGAGGSVYLVAADFELAPGAIRALGGLGYADVIRPGGDGGEGRVRIDFERISGETAPSPGAVNAVSEPDPGFTALP